MSDYSAGWTPPVTRHGCPIGPCPWTWDDPGPSGTVASDDDITAILLEHAVAAEAIIRGHLETHSMLDWVTEISRLQQERQRAERDGDRIAAILLRRLGGMAEVTDAELTAEDGMLIRHPVPHGFRIGLYERARIGG